MEARTRRPEQTVFQGLNGKRKVLDPISSGDVLGGPISTMFLDVENTETTKHKDSCRDQVTFLSRTWYVIQEGVF